MSDTAAMYLLWGPLGAEPLERFAESYRRHPAGADHRLVVLLKHVRPANLRDRCEVVARDLGAECLDIPGIGLDLDAYRMAADRVAAPVLCFLNTASEILGAGWLGHLRDALARSGVGIAGTTASNESLLDAAPAPLRPLLRRRYPPFPNPHLRTNGILLERELMRQLEWRPTRRKQDAWALENGANSLTRQVASRGQRALLVGRDGACYEQEQWATSRIFRSGGQENLLIADDRTREYAAADTARRVALSHAAWGDAAITA
jgi:hypothetical protein